MSTQQHRRQSGYSLVELLVTILIAGIAFAAMIPVFIDAHEVNQSDTVRTIARNVASDRIEKIRQLDYDDIEFDATKLNDPEFADGQFGPTWPNYESEERTYYVVYAVEPVPATAEEGLEQYKKVSVSVYWAQDFDASNPPPDDDSHRVELSTFIYRQFAGPKILLFDVNPLTGQDSDPPWVACDGVNPVVLTAKIDQADKDTTILVRFTVSALNGAQMARQDVKKTDTSATSGEPGYYDGELTFEWPWEEAIYAPSGAYTYSCTAYSKDGLPGNTLQVTYNLEQGVPPAPTNLTAFAGATSIQLSWDASPSGNVTRYAVERSVDGGAWTMLREDLPNATYTDSDTIELGRTYTYRVYAIDDFDQWSAASNEFIATPTESTDETPPPPPVLSPDYELLGKSVTIQWTQVADSPAPPGETQSGLGGYEVYRGTTADFAGATQIWNSYGPTGTYNDDDSSKSYGVVYYYWVVAYDRVLKLSPPSNVLVVPMGSVPKNTLTIKNTAGNRASVWVWCVSDGNWYTRAGMPSVDRPSVVYLARLSGTDDWTLPAYETYIVHYKYPGDSTDRQTMGIILDVGKPIVITG